MATPEEREAIRQASLKAHGYPPSGTLPPRDEQLNNWPNTWQDGFEHDDDLADYVGPGVWNTMLDEAANES